MLRGPPLDTLGGYGKKEIARHHADRERNEMSTVSVTVTGMSCGHCATSVSEEVGSIPGVKAVGVDLATGEVTVDSDAPVESDAIKSAVEEAGYQLAG
jgi:copper chaperone